VAKRWRVAGMKSSTSTDTSDMGKTYKAGAFSKQQWWGGKTYDTQAYQGTPDGSRFQTAARDQGRSARETGSAADIPGPYQTGNYQTGKAREASGKQLGKPLDAATANRRETFPEPEVQGWEEQRRLDLSTTKGILGR